MIKKVVKNLNTDSKKRLFIFIIGSVGFGIATLLLALKLSPWFYAINTRVRLYLEVPAETKILICWDRSQVQCLPLVPYSKTNNRIAEPGEIAGVWMSELPARSSYSITLIFKSSVKEALFRDLELDSSHVLLYGKVQGAGVSNIHFAPDQFKRYGVSDTVIDGLHYFESTTGSWLTLTREIYPGPSGISKHRTTIMVWSLLFSIYLLVVIPIYLLPHVILNLGSATEAAHAPKYSSWIYVLHGGAILAMLLLVVNSGVIFNEYDPLNYLSLALTGRWVSDTRLPGYPLFLHLALWIFHYDLNGVIFLQASIFALSVTVCICSLRKWIPQFAAILFVLLCVFSPAQIHWARWILRESLFTSLILLGATAVIAHFTGPKHLSKIWLYIFAAICGYAFLVRENGILLPFALLPVLVPEVIKRLFLSGSIWVRLRSVLSLAIHYSSPIVILWITYIVFCTYNYLHYGYFQIGIHQTSHSFLARTIYPGNSDARSLLDPSFSVSEEAKSYQGGRLYSSFILARDQTPKLDPVYVALYPSVQWQMSELGDPPNTFHLASILNEIGRGMNSLVPRKADLCGLLRQYAEVISLHFTGLYTLQVEDPYATTSRQELLDRLPIKVKLEEKLFESHSILNGYYRVTQGYNWYGLIFMLALLSSIYILKYEDAAFLAPMAIFIANCALLIATRLVIYRYLVSLDVLLVLQIVLGLSLWMNKNYYVKRISE